MAIPSSQDLIDFLNTLILGEFHDSKQQSSIAILLRGVIGVIPGVDQVLDAQDTIALIVRFNNKNWQLDQDDYVDLAFTAFGWIPEFGGLFKGILKPIWQKSRRNAQGVQNGIGMLESALGGRYGAVIGKMRSYIGNTAQWLQWTDIAVTKSNALLSAYIGMLQTVAKGYITFKPVSDWEWTHTRFDFPAWLVQTAKEQITPAQKLKQILAQAIREGAKGIRYFMQTLLGEHANLAMAAANGAASHTHRNRNGGPHAVYNANRQTDGKRRNSGTNPPTQSTASPPSKPYEHDPVRHDRHPTMTQGGNNGKTVQNAAANSGRRAAAVQKTKRAIEQIDGKLTGLIGEHMADYWMLEQLGGKAPHDHGERVAAGGCRKLNYGGRLYQLHQPSANAKGIDSLWEVNGRIGGKPYCILEAKASAAKLTRSLGALLTDGRDKNERRTEANRHQLQMSHEWCNLKLQQLHLANVIGNYSRRVVFFGMDDIAAHAAAHPKIIAAIAQPEKRQHLPRIMMEHAEHKASRIFTDEDIEAWVKTRTTGSSRNSRNPRKRR